MSSTSSPDEAAGNPIQSNATNTNINGEEDYENEVNVIETVNSKGDMVFYVTNDDKEDAQKPSDSKKNKNDGTPESSKTKSSEESAVMVEREDAEQIPISDDNVTVNDGGSSPVKANIENINKEAANAQQSPNERNQVEEVGTEMTEEPEQMQEETDNHDPVDETTANVASLSLTSEITPSSPQQPKPTSRISSFIHPSTPIPNSDSSLRILRKFINKTSRHFPTTFGGTKPPSLINYLFGSHNVDIPDACSNVYKELIDVISASSDSDENNDDEYSNVEEEKDSNENEVVIESILGHSGDTMSKARQAISAFCRLVETWCLETQRIRNVEMGEDLSDYVQNLEQSFYYPLQLVSESDDGEQYPNDGVSERSLYSVNTVVTSELMSIALSTAEALVAHGCFDGVIVGVGKEQSVNSSFDLKIMPSITEEKEETDVENDDNVQITETMSEFDPLEACMDEPKFENAVTVLAESIFLCYLDSEEVELSSLKFLLTTGCRTTISELNGHSEAMLRGSHLLQTIRMCYRVYLSTQSEANKTTARAALRQIVTSAFKRLDFKSYDGTKEKAKIVVESSGDDPFSPPPLFDESESDLGRKSDDRSTAGMSYGANFSSFEHKDAYLVLRSLCKLSMKATIGGGSFQNVVVVHDDNMRSIETGPSSRNSGMPKQEMMMDPALDSKILALDLLVEILQGTKTEVLQNAGPQLIYAVRNYLCHSLLKNCTSDNNYVVSLSLRLFVPLIRHFRSHLKTEIEAFVTNVFFVILDSKNSTIEHKLRVVILFEEICSDPATLAEIFLNYDCDLSAVDLFQRIVNTLARVAKIGLHDQGMNSGGIFVAGAGVSRAEKSRQDHRELRLEAMKAVRQVLSSLHESFVTPSIKEDNEQKIELDDKKEIEDIDIDKKEDQIKSADGAAGGEKKSLVQIYDSKKKRREEAAKATLRFNQKPTAGIKFASEVGLIDGDDPADVAQFLLSNKDVLDKTQIGEYLGREPDYQNGYPLKVLHQYLNLLDFSGLLFDDAIKFYLSGFRLPGEAQKIDRIMEKFAERYTTQNPEVFPTADAAFILAFSIIMLNTDLHNPAIKEERRMTKEGFLRNNSGICDGKDLPPEFLIAIFDRIKSDPISLKEDDELREKESENKSGNPMKSPNAGLFTNNFSEMDKKRESDYQKERDQILRNTESLLRRKKKRGPVTSGPVRDFGRFVSTEDSGLKYEYVIPMFDVTWGPALAVFSTVIESANGTMGTLLSIATDREIEAAAENAASATEICLSGFRLAIRIAALCGNDTARSAYVHALSNFSLLGTGRILEHRHIRCVQTLLEIARDDGELLGSSWEYVFKALSEISRLNQVHEATVKANRAEAEAYERRMNRKKKESESKIAESSVESTNDETVDDDDESFESEYMGSFEEDGFEFGEEMDKKAIDETNARIITDTIPEDISDTIYVRSSNLSIQAIKDFVFQLCRVSRMEIAGYGGHVGSRANDVDLTAVHYRKQHTLLTNAEDSSGRYNQPDIYSLQKLVEVTHYNMDSRPRLIFSEIWNIVSSHLTSTCLHDNAAVAIYAVDSFRQLSLQFLQREELGVFEFQRKFLKPFESVMAQCKNSSVKEFLLKAIEQIILMFEPEDTEKKSQTSIRSGWRPILTVIGLASNDDDDAIANLGFSMLTKQLRQTLHIRKVGENEASFSAATPLRADKFVDLIDALLMFTSGPREDKSSISIDHLVTIARYLADDNIPLPQRSTNAYVKDDGNGAENVTKALSINKQNSEELELWWPLLLGLSKSVGDIRPNIRIKGLVTLLAIINQHFFPSSMKKTSGVLGEIQTLQLIFKGILTPALEHAETSIAVSGQKIPLPDGFIRFMTRGSPTPEIVTKGGRKNRIEEMDMAKGNNWIDTTFDHLMDGSISLALKSLELYKDDILIEEVLAMFNNCLVSDSAILVIRGMKRLHHFVTSDLSLDIVSESTWATVCHMLRRCLSVRGLSNECSAIDDEQSENENKQIVREFLQEEEIFPARRYIGSNAAMIIGTILNDKQVVEKMGIRWYMFLLAGLGSGIKAWDRAAAIFDLYPPKSTPGNEAAPPQYAESSLYARKWVIRVLVRQLTTAEILSVTQTSGMLKDEFEALVSIYLKKEAQESSSGASPGLVLEMEHMAKMICDLLDAIGGMDDAEFAKISSLTPTLSACIQINDKAIRTAVHGLLQKIFQSSLLVGEKNN